MTLEEVLLTSGVHVRHPEMSEGNWLCKCPNEDKWINEKQDSVTTEGLLNEIIESEREHNISLRDGWVIVD